MHFITLFFLLIVIFVYVGKVDTGIQEQQTEPVCDEDELQSSTPSTTPPPLPPKGLKET